jgi:hypothetical protein
VAEGTSLLRMHTAYTCIVGSNPTVSASIIKTRFGGFFRFERESNGRHDDSPPDHDSCTGTGKGSISNDGRTV